MNSVKEYLFRDWTEFKSLFAERLLLDTNPSSASKPLSRGNFLFRGQEDSNWHLETSFSRKFGRTANPVKHSNLLEEFRKICTPIKEQEIINLDEIIQKDHELSALGQHYGLTSQLLDLTESPYIAAYFAFRFALTNLAQVPYTQIRAASKNVAIWALNSTDGKYWERVEDPKAPIKKAMLGERIPIIRAHPRHNDRLYRQLGWFAALDGLTMPMDEYVKNTWPGEIVLWKFLVPLAEVVHVMADLSLMGIDSTQMYGGFEGRALGALDNTIINGLI
jgi:hypothetical protein